MMRNKTYIGRIWNSKVFSGRDTKCSEDGIHIISVHCNNISIYRTGEIDA
jgi:hypothetical protein